MKVAPPGSVVTRGGLPAARPWVTWAATTSALLTALAASGTTANRPTTFLFTGRPYFDTTLGQPIWYDGSQWVDATGAGA